MEKLNWFSKENDGTEITNVWLPLNERKKKLYKAFELMENFIDKFVIPTIIVGAILFMIWMAYEVSMSPVGVG